MQKMSGAILQLVQGHLTVLPHFASHLRELQDPYEGHSIIFLPLVSLHP